MPANERASEPVRMNSRILYRIQIILGPWLVAAILGFLGAAKFGFWVMIWMMLANGYRIIRSLTDPDWHTANAAYRGVQPDLTNLVATRTLGMLTASAAARYLGKAVGYV